MKEAISRLKATPAVYVDALEERLTTNLPDPGNLIDYTENFQDAQKAVAILTIMGSHDLDKEGALGVLVWFYYQVAEDIELMQTELTNGTPADPEAYGDALVHAEYLYGHLLKSIRTLDDSTVLGDALDRYASQSLYVKRFIQGYSRVTTGTYPPPTETIEVTGSWQMIGLPLDPYDPNYLTVFSDDAVIQVAPYAWGGAGYVQVETLETGKAYWIEGEGVGTAEVIGGIETYIEIDVTEGWNMIAVPNCTPNDFHRFQINDENGAVFFTEQIYSYDGNYNLVNDFMSADQGYWLEVDADKTIHMDCDHPTSSKTGYSLPAIPESFGMLSLQDAAGGSQDLYFGGTLPGIDQRSFNMPPRPFEGNFDARLSGDTRLTEDDTAIIRFQAGQYPLTVELTRLPASGGTYLLEEFAGDQLVDARTIAPGAPLQITNESVSILRVRTE